MTDFLLRHLLSTFTFLLTLVFISFALRAKKPAGSTMAWLILIFVAPYVGIPLYLLLSGRKIPTRLAQKQNLYASVPAQLFEGRVLGVQKLLASHGVPSPRANNRVELLANGEEAFSCYVNLIRQAKESIFITTFIFGKDVVGKELIDALAERAAAGIDVRVIVDSIGAVVLKHPSLLHFKESKGKLAFFMPILHLPFRGRTNLRNHRKLLIVDGHDAIVGGMNLAKEYMGPEPDPNRWTDLAIHVQGNSVHDLTDIFLQDWIFATRNRYRDGEQKVTAFEKGGICAQVVASGPDVKGDPLYDVLLDAIFAAKKEVVIVTPYFIPDESLSKALEVAARSAVKVKVLLPGKSNHNLADLARGSFIRDLTKAGVEFHFYPKMIHAKAVLIDDSIGLVGSANFDMRSLLLNYELGILIYDHGTLEAIRVWIDQHLEKSESYTTNDNLFRQITEGIGRVIGPFI